MPRIADRAVAVTSGPANFHQVCDAVARGIMAGDGDSARIDIGRNHLPVQKLCRGNRENAGSGSDVERFAKGAPPRQALEGR